MRVIWAVLLASISVMGQAPDKVKAIAFDRSDREHCSVVVIEHRPMLQTVYGGTSVAVALPLSTVDGDFRVFVVVRQIGRGKVEVKPKEFSALYSDPVHTQLQFYDMAAEVSARSARQDSLAAAITSETDPGSQGASSTPGPDTDINRVAKALRTRNNGKDAAVRAQEGIQEGQQSKAPGTSVTPDELYLRRST